MSSEEEVKCFVMTEIRVLNFFHVYSINLGEASEKDIPKRIWNPKRAKEACKSGNISSDRNHVLEIVILLQNFVKRIQLIPSGHDYTEEC